jgi:hypothetical protein
VINELLAQNETDVTNEFHLHEDWIEILNRTNTPFSLSNCFISDEDDEPWKFAFPENAVVPANGYLIVWADNMNMLSGDQIHANFTLDEDGDEVYLTRNSGMQIDRIAFGEQRTDVSFARCPDGHGPFTEREFPSYASQNCIVGVEEYQSGTGTLQVFPNPSRDIIHIRNRGTEVKTLSILDITGKLIIEAAVKKEETLSIDASQWNNGLYILKTTNNESKKISIQH